MADMLEQLYSEKFIRKLETTADSLTQEYRSNEPYPHILIDDFFPEELPREVLKVFPKPGQVKWREYENNLQTKLEFNAAERLPQPIRGMLQFLNSSIILQFLERLTGITGLIADPYFTGGGVHQIKPGGKLEVHADFNKLEKLNLDRRLNLLVYLNPDWKEEYGGHFELWDRAMTHSVKKILPVFNRCVVFSTTDYSFHGHPTPLSCPPDRTRKSMAIYYYTNGRPEDEESDAHTTLWRQAPGSAVEENLSNGGSAKRVLKSLVPPIVTDAYRHLKKK